MSTVSGTVNHGITFGAAGYTSPLTVTTTGAINNNGAGPAIFGGTATVVNDGHITATGGSAEYSGVYLSDAGSYVKNQGTITGSLYAVDLTGGGSVVNSGSLYGGKWGITGHSPLTVTNTGTISGGSQGINLSGGGYVNNSNLISAPDGVGIGGAIGTVDNSGTIIGYSVGVALNAGGTVSNTGTGKISVSGAYAAVYITGGSGSVTNAGTLSGYIGAQFVGAFNDTLIDSGTIIGSSGTAVTFDAGNDLMEFTPSASVHIQGMVGGGGGTNTLEFASGASAGTLTGVGADFVGFSHGTVDSGAQWVFAGSNTIGATTTLTDSGTLTVTGTLENAGTITNASGSNRLRLAAGAGLVNDSGATIDGGTGTGIYGLSGGVTVVNLGAIKGGTAIDIDGAGSVTNATGGLIAATGTLSEGVAIAGDGSVSNQGTIMAPGDGIFIVGNGSVTNAAGGTITSSTSGIVIDGIGSVSNQGTIAGLGDGVDLVSGTVSNQGVISGPDSGIDMDAAGSVTNAGGGTITAAGTYGAAIIISGTGTVSNQGSIGARQTGVFIMGGSVTNETGGVITTTDSYSVGVNIDGSGSATNAAGGVIAVAGSLSLGLGIRGVGAVSNQGSISGSIGVFLAGGGTVSNSAGGAIVGNDGTAVYIQSGTVTNLGTIQATGTTGYGIDLAGGGTVIDSGTIIAAAGTAISFGGTANDLMQFRPSSSIYIAGTVVGGSGTNTLEFASAAGIGTLTGAGANFIGFGQGTIDAGARWVFAGRNTFGAGTTLVDSGTLVNAGKITGGTPAIDLAGGAYLSNQSTGTIVGVDAIFGLGIAQVVNAGSIGGNVATGAGVYLKAGGSVTNQSGGTISGRYGVHVVGATGTVSNQGSIAGFRFGVSVYDGSVTNETGGVITTTGGYGIGVEVDTGTVSNQGSIAGSLFGVLILDGSVTNETGGVITVTGSVGIGVDIDDSGSVTNAAGGVIASTGGYGAGISIHGVGAVYNQGSVSSGQTGVGVYLAGGTVSNSAGGVIVGNYGEIRIQYGTVTNLGTIKGTGTPSYGIYLDGGGTVIDSGTIIARGTAVDFGGTANDLMQFQPSSSIYIAGAVVGGSGTNTLEFASAASVGTLTGAGAYFAGFGYGTIDSGARWVFAGDNTIGAGTTLIDSGTLTNIGTVTNSSALTILGTLVNDGVLVTGTPVVPVAVGAGGYLLNAATGVISNGPVGHRAFGVGAAVYGTGAGTIVNLGSINSPLGNGISLRGGGEVINGATNDTSAVIYGGFGVLAQNVAATVVNFGTIYGGINLLAGGTVVDSGRIRDDLGSFTASYGMQFGGTAQNLLVLEHGYHVSGKIMGAASATNTVELKGTSGANAVTANYNGLSLTNFGTVAFASGANFATLKITDKAALPGMITGFTGVHDAIDLTTLSDAGNDASYSFSSSTHILTVTGDNGSVRLRLGNGAYSNGFVVTNDGSGGTEVTPSLHAAPNITSIATSGAGITNGAGDLKAGRTVTLTVKFDQAVTVDTSGGTPSLTFNDGGSATYAGGSGTNTLTFTYRVGSGQNTADLTVTGLSLNGGTIENGFGAPVRPLGTTNPAGTLQIDTTPPTVTPATATAQEDSAATPIGITVPGGQGSFTIKIASLPTDGRVFLADKTTAVTVGETLTLAQLQGLTFRPTLNQHDRTSALTYTLTDPAGNVTAGTATLKIDVDNGLVYVTPATLAGKTYNGGNNHTLIVQGSGAADLTGVTGFTQIVLTGAQSVSLGNGNFTGVTPPILVVTAQAANTTIDLSGMTGTADRALIHVMAAQIGTDTITGGGGGSSALLIAGSGTAGLAGVTGIGNIDLDGAATIALSDGAVNNFTEVTGGRIAVTAMVGHVTIDDSAVTRTIHGVVITANAADLTTDSITGSASGNDVLHVQGSGTANLSGVTGIGNMTFAGGDTVDIADANFTGTSGLIVVTDLGGGNTIDGSAIAGGHNLIVHGAAGDTLTGGGGDNFLVAGGGLERLVGGSGDTGFALTSAAGRATIQRFSATADQIVFSDAAFNLGASEGQGGATPKQLAASVFSANANGTFASAQNRFAYNSSTGVLYYSADGQNSDKVSVAVLSGHPTLKSQDLYFFA